ncbi:GntR family transcriptional regulator [Actinoplanes sp. NBRC 103695]|uniref:GntR family transcriptional regulator n=1 Tax=Actinoplanes sp. NBRC 103695 TaxID=3032202 RepID=UPI0024A1058E|nr:GntR family transcriptional regulator [Actinoplanes sp. NBRC 103695]GLY99147.1 GntR family transcriptional regulator [Actinoplanes sp. NBRC 103695]
MTVATQRVATHLRDAILGGALGPGDRVRQEDVAQQLGASRLPVREALQMLAAEGLIENEPNKGARVPRLSMHEVDVMYRMREQLEPLAVTESLPQLDESDLYRLVELQDEIEQGADVHGFLELDREFHLLTYAGCRTEQLSTTIHRLWNSTQHYRRAFVRISGPSRMWVVNAEHRLIIDAMFRRDEVDAGRFIAGHIRRTRIELGHHPEVFGAKP